MVAVTIQKSEAKRALKGNELPFAMHMAKLAGAVMLGEFKPGMEKALKPDRTVVTKADLAINDILLSQVRLDFPSHDVLAEEKSDMSRKSPLVWVCDPIDGTMSFCRGIPTCVFSLALVNEGLPVLGVVYDPFMDRMFHSVVGEGAFMNRGRIKVSDDKTIAGTAIGHAFWNSSEFKILDMWKDIQIAGASPVMLGSITYMGAMVACGQFSASVHPATSAHDTAALKVIVEEAGGKVTDLFGNDQRYDKELKGSVLSNGLVHDDLLRLVRHAISSAEEEERSKIYKSPV